MNRSIRLSNSSSTLKLEPINNRNQTDTRKSTKVATNASRFQSFEGVVAPVDMSRIIDKEDVLDLERKILTFQTKDEKANSSRYLFQLRRNYDDMSKQIVRKESDVDNLKGEIEVVKRSIMLSRDGQDVFRKNLEELQKNCETVRQKQQTSRLVSKTLEHISDRMKKDEYLHRLRITQFDKKVRQLDSFIKEEEGRTLQMEQHQSSNLVTAENVRRQFSQCIKQRAVNLEIYQNLVTKKQGSETKEMQRTYAVQEIQAIASSGLNDSNHIKWKKLLMVQLFVRKMFRHKVNDLESKYSNLIRCFNAIKVKTTVNNPQDLGQAYFQMDNIYKELLEYIRTLQQKQNTLSSQKQSLQGRWKEVRAESQVLDGEVRTTEEFETLGRKKEIQDRWFRIDLLRTKMHDWFINSKWRLESQVRVLESKGSYVLEHPITMLVEGIADYCDTIVERCQELETLQQPMVSFNQLRLLQAGTSQVLGQGEDQSRNSSSQQPRRDYH